MKAAFVAMLRDCRSYVAANVYGLGCALLIGVNLAGWGGWAVYSYRILPAAQEAARVAHSTGFAKGREAGVSAATATVEAQLTAHFCDAMRVPTNLANVTADEALRIVAAREAILRQFDCRRGGI